MPRMADGPVGEFKSRPARLARLFLRSRESWKGKCREAKWQIKLMRNRIRFLEQSKAALKETTRQLRAEAARLRAALAIEKNGRH